MNSIDTAIEYLKNNSHKMIEKGNNYAVQSVKMAIEALELQLNNGWIPISEKWPNKNGRYLVTYREWTDGNYLPKYDDTYVRILRYNKAIFRLPVCCDMEAENDTHREVLAWCELPEPYEGVSE